MSVSSHSHPLLYMVCADSESDTTLTTEVGQCMSYLAQGGHSTGASKVAGTRMSALSFIHF